MEINKLLFLISESAGTLKEAHKLDEFLKYEFKNSEYIQEIDILQSIAYSMESGHTHLNLNRIQSELIALLENKSSMTFFNRVHYLLESKMIEETLAFQLYLIVAHLLGSENIDDNDIHLFCNSFGIYHQGKRHAANINIDFMQHELDIQNDIEPEKINTNDEIFKEGWDDDWALSPISNDANEIKTLTPDMNEADAWNVDFELESSDSDKQPDSTKPQSNNLDDKNDGIIQIYSEIVESDDLVQSDILHHDLSNSTQPKFIEPENSNSYLISDSNPIQKPQSTSGWDMNDEFELSESDKDDESKEIIEAKYDSHQSRIAEDDPSEICTAQEESRDTRFAKVNENELNQNSSKEIPSLMVKLFNFFLK